MAELTMPSLGADMEAGTLVEWRVKLGDSVQRGDIVALVETQKGLIDIEVWETGVIDELRVKPGQQVPVGSVLATLRAPGGALTPGGATTEAQPAGPSPAPPMDTSATAARSATAPLRHAAPAAPSRPASSPSARRLARELEVDLDTVEGTGPHGAITRDDVTRAATAKAKAPPPPEVPATQGTRTPAPAAGAMRQAIAAAMARSKREIPHYYLALDIDVTPALEWLEAENEKRAIGDRILLAALLLKATALGVRKFEEMNGYYTSEGFRPQARVHVGVGIALRQGGLVAPAIHDVDGLSVSELMARLLDLVKRTRGGGLRSSELSDSTITVTNLGDQGADSVFGIIYPPQVALVGFGKPRMRPWARDGMLGVRSIVTATLAADHRVSDGHTGARFLNAIAHALLEPEKL